MERDAYLKYRGHLPDESVAAASRRGEITRSRSVIPALLGGVLILGGTGQAPAAGNPDFSASPCAKERRQDAVCAAANRRAIEIMSASDLAAVTVVQDVRSGAVVAFAASRPSILDVATPVLPLSLSKLLIEASWWDHQQPESVVGDAAAAEDRQEPVSRSLVTVNDMLAGSIDSAGREMAVALRRSVGTRVMTRDFERYGFGRPTRRGSLLAGESDRHDFAPIRIDVAPLSAGDGRVFFLAGIARRSAPQADERSSHRERPTEIESRRDDRPERAVGRSRSFRRGGVRGLEGPLSVRGREVTHFLSAASQFVTTVIGGAALAPTRVLTRKRPSGATS